MTINHTTLTRMSLSEINQAIEDRKTLLDQMVGTLYPAIIWGEMDQLTERRDEIVQVLKKDGKIQWDSGGSS